MRLTTQIKEYDMDQVILDLRSDPNMLPNKIWELMGRPKLQWSLIQLRITNQQKILPMGRLPGIVVDIEGVCAIAEFEVIEIVDDTNPRPALLGLDQAFDNLAIINLKKRQMVFEKDNLRVIVPLDSSEGVCYIEPICDQYCDAYVDKIYQMIAKEEDCINPTMKGTLDSKEELEKWQNKLHEVSIR